MWDDVWFEELDPLDKLVWIYLLTNKNTNMLGVYELSMKRMSFEIGLPLERIKKAFESFETLKKAKYINGYIVLYNWIKNQSYNTNMKKSALNEYQNLPNNVKLSIKERFDLILTESFGSLSKDYLTLPKNEKEKEKENEIDLKNALNVWEEFCKEKPGIKPFISRMYVLHKFESKEEIKDSFQNWFLKNQGRINDINHAENSFNSYLEKNPRESSQKPKYPKSTLKDNWW